MLYKLDLIMLFSKHVSLLFVLVGSALIRSLEVEGAAFANSNFGLSPFNPGVRLMERGCVNLTESSMDC